MLQFFATRHTSDVAPVVVAKQDNDIIGHAHSFVIVVEHLFIERPHLLRLTRGSASDVCDDVALVLHDALQKPRIGLLTHSLVAIATHTDSHQVLGATHTLDALAEETVEHSLVRLIIPRTVFAAVASPFLVVARHRFMVACAYNNTHFIGQYAIFRVIGIECPAPHGRPEQIASQTQDEFEHLLVECMTAIVGAECVLHPRSQARRLIVQEDTTILHSWFAIGEDTLAHENRIMMLHRHVGPVVPRRYSHLSRQLVNAIDGATSVAACNNQLAADHRNEELLATTLELRSIDLTFFRHFIDDGRVSYRSHNDDGLTIIAHLGSLAGHPAEVFCEVCSSTRHTLAVGGRHIDGCTTIAVEQQVAALETHKLLGSRDRERQQREQKHHETSEQRDSLCHNRYEFCCLQN